MAGATIADMRESRVQTSWLYTLILQKRCCATDARFFDIVVTLSSGGGSSGPAAVVT